MEDLINYKEFLDLRKKELLHKRWTDRVYQPIRRQVVKEIKSREFGELFQRKRQLYKEYLEHVNKKVWLSVLPETLCNSLQEVLQCRHIHYSEKNV